MTQRGEIHEWKPLKNRSGVTKYRLATLQVQAVLKAPRNAGICHHRRGIVGRFRPDTFVVVNERSPLVAKLGQEAGEAEHVRWYTCNT